MYRTWRDFPHCRVPVVKARVEQVLARVRGPRVLDIGCNEGFLSKAIQETHGFDVVSVDNSDKAIAAARGAFDLQVLKMDAYCLGFAAEEFDTVLGCEILEHVENPGAALAEMFRVSKGLVIVTLPIGAYWLGEKTHLWELGGCSIGHDAGPAQVRQLEKDIMLIEFKKRRAIHDGTVHDIG